MLKMGGGCPYFHTSKRKLQNFPQSAKTLHVGINRMSPTDMPFPLALANIKHHNLPIHH